MLSRSGQNGTWSGPGAPNSPGADGAPPAKSCDPPHPGTSAKRDKPVALPIGEMMRWCQRRHPKEGRKWIKQRYFQHEGHRDWVFTGMIRDSKGSAHPIRLMQASGVKVLRWKTIRSAANPYDPEWELSLGERSVWKTTAMIAN